MKLEVPFIRFVEPDYLIPAEEKKLILKDYLNNLVQLMLTTDEDRDWVTDKFLIEIKRVKKYIKNIEHEAH